jgi:flagellin-like protein
MLTPGINMSIFADKKGISPIVATILMVAATVVSAVAIAYWMGGVAGLYTRYEKIEIVNAHAVSGALSAGGEGWTITISLKNVGSADTSIENILINGKPFSHYTHEGDSSITVKANGELFDTDKGAPLKVGQIVEFIIEIPKCDGDPKWPFTPGVSLEVRLRSAAGQEYIRTLAIS